MVGSQNNVVYKPAANATTYELSTCQAVKVQLIYPE